MSRELAPPMVMRHLERGKDPLPAIGSTPHRHTPSQDSGSPKSEISPPKALLNESPTMVGSLALARRRHRVSPEHAENRSPSPDEVEEEQKSTRRQHSLLDVLDPDTDGSIAVRSEGVSPTSRHHGKLEPLDSSALSHVATSMTTKPHQISPLHK